jgi:hypothetical protein
MPKPAALRDFNLVVLKNKMGKSVGSQGRINDRKGFIYFRSKGG